MKEGIQVRAELSMRLMAEVENEDAVAKFIPVVLNGLAQFASVEKWTCERYWKIPDYFEIQLQLQPVGEFAAAYQGITSLLPVWQHEDEAGKYAAREALWNREIDPDSNFLHPSINWVQVFLVYRAILPHPPQFRAGERVRWIGTADPEDSETAALVGTTAIVEKVWPTLDGYYEYSATFEHVGEDEPLLWAREDELELP